MISFVQIYLHFFLTFRVNDKVLNEFLKLRVWDFANILFGGKQVLAWFPVFQKLHRLEFRNLKRYNKQNKEALNSGSLENKVMIIWDFFLKFIYSLISSIPTIYFTQELCFLLKNLYITLKNLINVFEIPITHFNVKKQYSNY